MLQEREGSNIKFIHGILDDEDEIVSNTSDHTWSSLTICWGLGGAAVCGCDTPWAFLLPFFFTGKGRHRIATVVYITQNLFQQSKAYRTFSLNAHSLILLQSPRDKMQKFFQINFKHPT